MTALENQGYRIRTYEGFMRGAVDFHSFDGCQHMTAAEIRARQKYARGMMQFAKSYANAPRAMTGRMWFTTRTATAKAGYSWAMKPR